MLWPECSSGVSQSSRFIGHAENAIPRGSFDKKARGKVIFGFPEVGALTPGDDEQMRALIPLSIAKRPNGKNTQQKPAKTCYLPCEGIGKPMNAQIDATEPYQEDQEG
jgi:hypothetical protein